jgi:putative OPT family oligopeptide transporter
MSSGYKPFIAPEKKLPELTIKAIILGCFLALVLAISNTYLALKIGVLTASSIPAAILSMGILRLFPKSNILENNLVQTCASAGEAIAGGIVYTAPALIIIHYWMQFNYIQTFCIALIGGVLGVMFTIPLRRAYMNEPQLRFPEGAAIAEVLKAEAKNTGGIVRLLLGGTIGAFMELCQTGFKLIADKAIFWLTKGTTTTGFGFGFSATLIGAGYLIGFEVGLSIFIGAIIANIFCVGILSHLYAMVIQVQDPSGIANNILNNKVRYIGIGAMLVSGVATLFILFKPLYDSINKSLHGYAKLTQIKITVRTEHDIPTNIVILLTAIMTIASYILINTMFNLDLLNIATLTQPLFITMTLLYILLLGFISSMICGYFSGLVGVAASPGSSIAIAAVLIAALVLKLFLNAEVNNFSFEFIREAEAITIVLASIVMGAACVANNNSQDLKVGHIVGATPWKQQLMLLLGGLIAALIIPVIMQLLFNVYGIAGIVPHSNMNTNETLAAPPAAAMAAISQGVFSGNLPWDMIETGGAIALLAILTSPFMRKINFKLSLIGLAVGIYLPLSSSTPLFIGALLSLLVNQKLNLSGSNLSERRRRGIILACGLVAGAAVMNVLLAIPFSLLHNPNSMNLLPQGMHGVSIVLAIVATVLLCGFIYHNTTKN